MTEITHTYKVCVKLDENNIITTINSSAFLPDTTGWTVVDEGTGDRYHHAQGNYLPKGLVDGNGSYNYRYIDGVLAERTEEEKKAEREAKLLPSRKVQLISDSKKKLAQWLADNPIQFTDGKFYSVTEEKQTLLNSNLASYERALNACVDYPLKWNATGETCVDWTYSELLTLSLAIAGYVAPKVALQQAVEMQIKACSTLEECEAITIDYN